MKISSAFPVSPFARLACLLGALSAVSACSTGSEKSSGASGASGDFQRDFALEGRKLGPTGRNEYFVLEPGFQLELASDDGKLTITVLEETKQIGGVTTRVVEEREEEDGELVEVSRNYFAIDEATKDVFYFGEQVDVYDHGKLTGHPGAWLAGEKGARAGLVAPGAPRVGMRYYQELAPDVAMDRAEVVDLAAKLKTPAGEFKGCLKTHESTGLDKKESETKLYAPGIGLIQDEDLLLVRSGTAAKR
ncbi:MAG TPA: hypothetical protein VM509_15135 [Planctomycetota bacterium]|nr:hypothetical protein [Planctomycetota bacterium]